LEQDYKLLEPLPAWLAQAGSADILEWLDRSFAVQEQCADDN
jgi:hypothetical protein